jgi:hypothetical protein
MSTMPSPVRGEPDHAHQGDPMLRHIVLTTFAESTTDRQKQDLADALRTLPALIDDIATYSVGLDLGLSDQNAGLAIVAEFADVEAYRRYVDHPDHQRVAASLREIATAVTRVQHEL